ncbi:carotenoid oxygenase [Calothrix sp. PCC 7716]|nr:carotenoid oxygenase [Calothrix sp. PCC 7716]
MVQNSAFLDSETKLEKESKNTYRAWKQAITEPGEEFPPTPLPVLEGKIPLGLRGTLYRIGPGRLSRGGIQVGHWFDGDGAILRVHFGDDGATGLYRYVQTKGYQHEVAAGKLLYGNYGMIAPGRFWNHFLRPLKNVANTAVIALPDKLLALWEGGKPHALDLETLETRGIDNLGALKGGLTYSAHPKRDPQTGEIFNFGITGKFKGRLNLYKSDSTGKILVSKAFPLDWLPLVHDFVLAGQYLIFLIPPVKVHGLPVGLGLRSYGNSMTWEPNSGTQILVFDKQTLSLVSRSETEGFFLWHFGNGYVDENGMVMIDFAGYEDFNINQRLKELPTGELKTPTKSGLWQLILNPKTGKVKAVEKGYNHLAEFPMVPPLEIGQKWRYTYFLGFGKGTNTTEEFFNAIARIDYKSDSLTIADLGENRYPLEPTYVAYPMNPQSGWLLTIVYNGNIHTSEVWIFDSEHLNDEPVCKLGLPSVIPLGFHGIFNNYE